MESVPRRSQRSTKGVIPVRFQDDSSIDEAASEVSSASTRSRSSSSQLAQKLHRAELDTELKLARLEEEFERKQLLCQRRIIQLRLAAQRAAAIDEEQTMSDVSGSGLSFKTRVSTGEEGELDDGSDGTVSQDGMNVEEVQEILRGLESGKEAMCLCKLLREREQTTVNRSTSTHTPDSAPRSRPSHLESCKH